MSLHDLKNEKICQDYLSKQVAAHNFRDDEILLLCLIRQLNNYKSFLNNLI